MSATVSEPAAIGHTGSDRKSLDQYSGAESQLASGVAISPVSMQRIRGARLPKPALHSPTRALRRRATQQRHQLAPAIRLLRDLNHSGKRDIPADAPMPFRKDWKRLISEQGRPNRRHYETAVFATLRDKLRSGDVWVEGSSNYRRFDSYLLPPGAVPAIAAELGLPATADEWLARRGRKTTTAGGRCRGPRSLCGRSRFLPAPQRGRR